MIRGREKDVDSAKCKFLPKPDIVRRRCNYHCKLEWRIATRGECSEPCGLGHQNITHRCHKIMHDKSVATVLDTYCSRELTTKPEHSVPCEGLCEGVQWSFGEWGSCSKTCGPGHQTRAVRCLHQKSGRDMKEDKCGKKNESLARRPCVLGSCPSWEVGRWSECSVLCGIGISEREYWCSLDGRQLDRRRCNEMTIPHHRKECFEDSQCGRWKVGQWSLCSSNCGPGVRTRKVTCVGSNTQNEIKDADCDEENKPSIESACVELSCQHDDMSALDTETINDDESEYKKNDATAEMDATSRRHRHELSRDRDRKRRRHHYNLPRYRWKIGRWEKCSLECGGFQTRVVACYDRVKGRLETDQSRCSKVRPRPRDNQPCKSECISGVWKPGNWSLCSSSCGPGVRWRAVECYNKETNEKVITDLCSSGKEKPKSEEQCLELEFCPRPVMQVQMKQIERDRQVFSWREGNWGLCSATCGGGTKVRQVECLNMEGQRMAHDHCLVKTKPQMHDVCNQEPCPAWNFGGWGRCDKPCDGGVTRRLVRCQNHLGQDLPDTQCSLNTRPLDTRSCNTNACNTFRRRRYLWKVGKWGQVKQCNVINTSLISLHYVNLVVF